MKKLYLFAIPLVWANLLVSPTASGQNTTTKVHFDFKNNDADGQLVLFIDGKEAWTYCYGPDVDLPHFYPVRSPSGQSLTVQRTDPYPHHRSVWFADTVRLEGQRSASFYNAFYSRGKTKDPKAPFRDHIHHVSSSTPKIKDNKAELVMNLVWEMDQKIPVLDEKRQVTVVTLGQGEYFLDHRFTLTASHGNVTFESDAVHYAWPYVRISPEFAKGATITNSEGKTKQTGTNNQVAAWVDYSNKTNNTSEGLALFSHPDNGPSPRWLTRDYGTFGPRRPDAQSGKKFTLQRGQQLTQRAGILIHRGDVAEGQVAERYKMYAGGKLD